MADLALPIAQGGDLNIRPMMFVVADGAVDVSASKVFLRQGGGRDHQEIGGFPRSFPTVAEMIRSVGLEGEACLFSPNGVVASEAELAILDGPVPGGGGVQLGEAAQRQALVAVAPGAFGLNEGVICGETAGTEGGRRFFAVAGTSRKSQNQGRYRDRRHGDGELASPLSERSLGLAARNTLAARSVGKRTLLTRWHSVGVLPRAHPAGPDLAGEALARPPPIKFFTGLARSPPIRPEITGAIMAVASADPPLVGTIVVRLLVVRGLEGIRHG